MSDPNFYDLLGVSKTAAINEIRTQYKKLSLQYHPDKNPQGADMFKKISRAHEVLTNPQKRQLYDKYGEQGVQISEAGNEFNISTDDVPSRWRKIALGYFLVILLDYALGMHTEWIGITIINIYFLFQYDATTKRILFFTFLLFLVDLLFYFIIPTNYIVPIASGMMYASLMLYGNQVKTLWDITAVLWVVLMFLDYYFDRYYPFWTLFAAHSIVWSSIFMGLMIYIFNTQPFPDLYPSYLTKFFHHVLITPSALSPIIGVLFWTLVFSLDYWTGTMLEWIPPAVLAILSIWNWPIIITIIYIVIVLIFWYWVPFGIMSFLSTLELQVLVFVMLCYWNVPEQDAENKSLKDAILSAPKALYVTFLVTGYLDFFYRIKPSRFEFLGVMTGLWGLVTLLLAILNEIVNKSEKKEEKEDSSQKTDINEIKKEIESEIQS